MREIASWPFSEKYNFQSKTKKYIILILLLINSILLILNGINLALDPDWYDTTAYLGIANFIQHHGGVFNFYNLCITGVYQQANQHPLYIILLAPFASTNISFFITAKFLSGFIGLILLVTLYVIGRKMYGELVASLAVFALLLNSLFIQWTSVVACESLLMLLYLIAVYFIMEGFKDNKKWLYAGIFSGLAYLTKGTGILLVPGFLIASIIMLRVSLIKNKFFWLFFIMFAFSSSPLLIRNLIYFQNPFYNVNNLILTMGQDKIDRARYVTSDLIKGIAIWTFEESQISSDYEIRNENLKQNQSTEIKKLISQVIESVEIFLFTSNIDLLSEFESRWLNRIFTLPIALLFLVGIAREKNHGGLIFLLITILAFIFSLSFLPIDRYFLPLIPLMWIYISLGALTVYELIHKRFLYIHNFLNIVSVSNLLIFNLLIIFGYSLLTREINNPMNSVDYSKSREILLKWLRNNLESYDKYTMGPNLNWQLNKGIWVLPPKITYGDFSKFKDFVKRHEIKYIIVGKDTWKDFSEPKNFTGASVDSNLEELIKHFDYDPKVGIMEVKKVDEWKLVFKDHDSPTDFIVYELVD